MERYFSARSLDSLARLKLFYLSEEMVYFVGFQDTIILINILKVKSLALWKKEAKGEEL